MARLSPARRLALSYLQEAHAHTCYVRDVIDRHRYDTRVYDTRDIALAERLSLGVTATAGCLDELIDRYVVRPNKLKNPVRFALRIATFELAYLGRPQHIAVSQGVELVRSVAKSAAGLANAVLHNVADAVIDYRAATDVTADHQEVVQLARSCGLPVWLVENLEISLGDERTRALCAGQLEPAPLAACFVTLPPEEDQLWSGTARVQTPFSDALRRMLLQNLAVISDAHAQLIAAGATAPGSLLEIGAGRGTKSFVIEATARRLGLRGTDPKQPDETSALHIVADLASAKGKANLKRLRAAGMAAGVVITSGDCTHLDRVLGADDGLFDTVLLDAPCSGTGTMRRHPEIPWRLTKDDVQYTLPALQYKLLYEAAARVKPHGQLLYATCSVMSSENRQVVEQFLASDRGAAFKLVPLSDAPCFIQAPFMKARAYVHQQETPEGYFQTYPALNTFDGHFCARLVRVSA